MAHVFLRTAAVNFAFQMTIDRSVDFVACLCKGGQAGSWRVDRNVGERKGRPE
jgi:hypothetical protein